MLVGLDRLWVQLTYTLEGEFLVNDDILHLIFHIARSTMPIIKAVSAVR